MMKEGYFFLGALILFHFGRVAYFYYQKWQRKRAELEIADYKWETYLTLREKILSTQPVDVGIELPYDTETAFAVAQEIHTGVEVQIIVLFKTGETWVLTTRNARKDIFIPKNENFLAAVASVFTTAQYNFARMRRKYISVPEPRSIKFHIITNNDIYSADSLIQNIISETSDWQELYAKMNEALEQSEGE
ncbi:hypothetical protein IDJ75_13345 [Mucilaginibacter rigui]|uniref:DUF4230 domain-containing protein n=1 Tax=Mucilaginibacter rigui TaxID=534635 RepID=A0ABR7X9G3_9SPHI|nr:hypothetical protein [Mucilaginibacter rigui]MBD1386265.1 hypothetical protein [Mucilaginibacter rigui]